MRLCLSLCVFAFGGALLCARVLRRKRRPHSDLYWLRLAEKARVARRWPPSQSAFRVVCVLPLPDGAVYGFNDEAWNLPAAICAERAAFLQLANRNDELTIDSVYIVCDAKTPITSGTLCREYMYSSRFTRPETRIVTASFGRDGTVATLEATLAELWPWPSPYARLSASQQCTLGRRLAALLAPPSDDLARQCYDAARAACRDDDKSDLHPIRYGAAAVFRDGSTRASRQWKALEYGASLDPIGLLAPALEAERCNGNPALIVAMVDDFGVAHAPFARGRALLVEHGFARVAVICHRVSLRSGDLSAEPVMVPASELTPLVPAFTAADFSMTR